MSWFSRLFRSRAETLAERAEVEGRFEDAARLYAEYGARAEAFRVLIRAAEATTEVAERRRYLTRAYTLAKSDDLRAIASRGLALCTLAEFEVQPPRNRDERTRLEEAAAELEKAGVYREASRAYRLLDDRDGVERSMMLAGDIEAYEKETTEDHEQERHRLRRRNAVESFETLWRSGDRIGGLAVLEQWLAEHTTDAEARLLFDERRALIPTNARLDCRLNDVNHQIVGAFPVSLGREAAVILRELAFRVSTVWWNSRALPFLFETMEVGTGTRVSGIPLAGTIPLAVGQEIAIGTDLSLRVVEAKEGCAVLEIDRGMDRGRRFVFLTGAWTTPLGVLHFDQRRPVLEPAMPVQLSGQRVVAAICLAKGDRVECEAGSLELQR